MAHVIVVEDEEKLGRLIAETLEDDGHVVRRYTDGARALAALAEGPVDVVLTDLRLPGADGLQVLERARRLPRPPEVVMMTAWGTTQGAVEAMKAGAADYLLKPFVLDELSLRVRRLVEQRQASQRGARLLGSLTPSLVAQSPAMKAVLAAAERVATTDTTVLLVGESGTGKSQLARYLHYCSARAPGPLVEVHCSALPDSLLESELFGSVKGAFTGADANREGHLGRADGGTLFLDEVGEISAMTQVKLLRFLQEREFVPVGGTAARRVDTRVVAATNRDLAQAVRSGAFREDFFYRLNVFTIEVPPLRQRRDDLPALVDRFLDRRGLPAVKVSAPARAAMGAHDWPGNVRELENVLERALILAGEEPVTPAHLRLQRDARASGALGDLLVPGFNLDALELDLLHAALDRAGGNKAAAARLLGISRRRLYSRLHSLEQPEGDDIGG